MDRASRAARLADQIRDYLAIWLNRDFPGSLVSVSSVQLSVNSQYATVWLTFLGMPQHTRIKDIAQKKRYYQSQLRHALNRAAVPLIAFDVELAADEQI